MWKPLGHMRRWPLGAVVLAFLLLLQAPAHAARVQSVVSPGGIEAWLVEDHSLPIVAIEFAFTGGAALDPAGKEGLANLVSGTIDEGSGPYDSLQFRQLLEDNTVELSFDTGRDNFTGSMRTITRNLDEAVTLMRLALTQPRFDPEPVERIRTQIVTSLRARQNRPGTIVGRTFWETVFPDHPYGRPTRGTPASVATITVGDMRAFVRTRFARDRLTIGVEGDITPEALAQLLDTAFGDLPATSEVGAVPDTTPQGAGETVVVALAVPQSSVLIGQKGVLRDDPDYYAAYLLNHILGGGSFTSRLYQEVREERGLAYSVSSFLVPFDHAALWMASVGSANESVGESVRLIREEWQRVHEKGVTAEELENAKLNVTGSFALRLDNSSGIAGLLVGMQLEDLGIDYIDQRNTYIDAVTLDDVARVARDVLYPDDLTVVAVGQPDGIEATAPAPAE